MPIYKTTFPLKAKYGSLIMTVPKLEAKKIIDSLPEDTSYDEILKELAFDRMIQRAKKDLQISLYNSLKCLEVVV